MKELFANTWVRVSTYVLAGALLGFGYFFFIGCETGSCAITSNPYISTAYGSFFGLVMAFNFKSERQQEEDPDA